MCGTNLVTHLQNLAISADGGSTQLFLCSLLAPAVAGWVVDEDAPLYGPDCSMVT